MLEPMIKTPRDYQCEIIDDVFEAWESGHQNVLAVLPTGGGKCLGENTPVLMADGTIKMVQDVVKGDYLMGINGQHRKVLSTTTGVEMLYKVTPVKGEPYVVNESHILSLKKTGTDEVINIEVGDYIQKSKTFKHTHKGWRTSTPNFKNSKSVSDDFLPPYMLGLWLGDGNSRSACVTSADHEIVKYIYDFANRQGLVVRKEMMTGNKSSNYHITNNRNKLRPSLRKSLKDNNLLLNKHIPHKYKTATIADRFELLAGVIDADGYLHPHGYYDLVFKSETLSDDVIFVARSLGFAAYKKPAKKTCTNTGVTGDYFRISISGDINQIPTKLCRHQADERKQKKSVLKTGIKVEPIGQGDYYGFEIDGDRLFLLGDFTVTHNTIIKSFVAKYFQTLNKYSLSNPNKYVVIFAHRDVLLEQISLAAAKVGLVHQLMCSKPTERAIGNSHVKELNHSYVDSGHTSKIIIASVPTWVKRDTTALNKHIGLWLMDESHHVLEDNQWGRAVKPMMQSAIENLDPFEREQFISQCEDLTKCGALGLGVTATPLRADRKALGRDWDGIFDVLIEGLTMDQLIKKGALSPYRIYTTPDKVDTRQVKVTTGGDYNRDQLAKATDDPDITGDAVQQYKKVADGKQTIVFAVNIEHSNHVAQEYKVAGISAVSLSSKTPIAERQRMINQFRLGQIKVLVNCDLFGEGFDVPAVECVQMLRKTKSYGLFMQMFGRMLRPAEGKPFGILIDHVGNLKEHCSTRRPHESPKWSLEPTENKRKRKNSDDDEEELFTRICPECGGYYEPKSKHPDDFVCPFCGHAETQPEINAAAKELIIAEGDLIEYDTSFMDAIIAERKKVDRDVSVVTQGLSYGGKSSMVISSVQNKHLARQAAQHTLRQWINSWCYHMQLQYGYEIDVVRAEFKRIFRVDVYTAATLGARDADELSNKVRDKWSDHITIKKVV